MPYNPAGLFSLVASYFANPGTTIRTEQHNPVFEDVASALSSVVLRDGRAPMTGPLNMNSQPINNVATGSSPTSVATLSQAMPIGAIIDFGGSTAPAGWALCFGQSLNRTTYAALYAIIGTTFGAVDGASFNLPDLRGRVIAGPDTMGGSPAGRLPGSGLFAVGGAATVTLGIPEMPYHFHGGATQPAGGLESYIYDKTGFQPTGGNIPGGGTASLNSTPTFTNAVDRTHIHGINPEGGNLPHNNVQPTMCLNKIMRISYDG